MEIIQLKGRYDHKNKKKGIGFRWKILGENMLEIGRIIDPSSKKETFFREIFTALPDSYALVSNDHLIAIIANESLSEIIEMMITNHSEQTISD